MSTFLLGNQLDQEVENIIQNARKFLWFISPDITLRKGMKAILKRKLESHKLKMVFVFSVKDKYSQGLPGDIEFLKQFPNITIRFDENLQSSFYASEDHLLFTFLPSENDIENLDIRAGISMKHTNNVENEYGRLNGNNDAGNEALNYFNDVINHGQKLFEKKPTYIPGFFTDKYTGSKINADKLDTFFDQAIAA